MTPETPPTPKFAIGDVVQLKSGGPDMTVAEHQPPFFQDMVDRYNVTWFNGSELQWSWVPSDCLKTQDNPCPTLIPWSQLPALP